MNTYPILLLLTFIAAASATQPPLNPQQLIDASCKLVASFDGRYTKEYCISAINTAKYNRNAKMSLPELGAVALEVLHMNVSATKAKIEQRLHAEKNPKVQNILHHCNSMYSEANHRVKDAREFMATKEYEMADRTLSMIEGDGAECEAMFLADKLRSPITRENLDTEYLGTMATQFIRFFDKSFTPWGVPIVKKSIFGSP